MRGDPMPDVTLVSIRRTHLATIGDGKTATLDLGGTADRQKIADTIIGKLE